MSTGKSLGRKSSLAATGGMSNPLHMMPPRQLQDDSVPADLENNPLYSSLAPFLTSRTTICNNGIVYASVIEVKLPDEPKRYLLAAKRWQEHRCSSCNQLLAAARASNELKGCSTAHELASCRVQGHGNVAFSRYAGRSLGDLIKSGALSRKFATKADVERFLQKLSADLLLELLGLQQLGEGGLSFRDLKPDNIVDDVELDRWSLIDFGLAIPFDGTHFFSGFSAGFFPVDLAAINPDDGQPWYFSEEGQQLRTAAVNHSRAGGIDSNLLGLTLLTTAGALNGMNLPAVTYLDSKYRVPADEAAKACNEKELYQLGEAKEMHFATDYLAYMSDKQGLRSVLQSLGLSTAAVKFLLSLLEVDPENRPSIEEAMRDPWVQLAVIEAQQQRAARLDQEQAIADHYAGFGAALEKAIQQRKLEKQQSAATVVQCLGDAQHAIASLQQQVLELQHRELVLQQQVTTAQRPILAANGSLLDKLAIAQADAAAVQQLCEQQDEIISSLQQQVATHQQFAEMANSTIQQLQQQLAESQQQREIVSEPVTASGGKNPAYATGLGCSSNHGTAAADGLVSGGKVECTASDGDNSSGNSSNRSSCDGKPPAPRTPVFSQDSSSINPFGNCCNVPLECKSQMVTAVADGVNSSCDADNGDEHVVLSSSKTISTAAAEGNGAQSATTNVSAAPESAADDQVSWEYAAAGVASSVGELGSPSGVFPVAIGAGAVTAGLESGPCAAGGGEVAVAVVGSTDGDYDVGVSSAAGVAGVAGGMYRLLMSVSAWMSWLDD